MLMVKVNLGLYKLFGINYIFVSDVYSSYLYGSKSPFIFFNMYMFLGVFYGVLIVFKYPI
jgi:hypothetical protein